MMKSDIDLNPKNWKSDRPKGKQPFFGSGAPGALAYILSFAVVFTVLYYFRN
jgi:hypothetical protein